MHVSHWLRFPALLHDIVSDASGSGGTGAGVGDPVGGSDAPAEPTVIDLSDDSLVKYPGSEKPTKFKDIRNFQSNWTRESQKRAKVEQELAASRAQLARYEQERQAQGQRQSQTPVEDDIMSQLGSLPYLSGEQAAKVVQNIQSQMAQRDNLQMRLLQQVAAMKQQLSTVYDSHSSTSFDSKIDKWLAEGSYAPEFKDLAKEIYLAYEGDDLDIEFPRIFAERVEQMERAFEAKRRSAVDRNRQNRFVPGKGGAGVPNKPLQFTGAESAAQITEALFPTFAETGT